MNRSAIDVQFEKEVLNYMKPSAGALPAIYHRYEPLGKAKRRRVVVNPMEDVSGFVDTELSLGELGKMAGFLWFAGAKHPATPLYLQVAMGRGVRLVIPDYANGGIYKLEAETWAELYAASSMRRSILPISLAIPQSATSVLTQELSDVAIIFETLSKSTRIRDGRCVELKVVSGSGFGRGNEDHPTADWLAYPDYIYGEVEKAIGGIIEAPGSPPLGSATAQPPQTGLRPRRDSGIGSMTQSASSSSSSPAKRYVRPGVLPAKTVLPPSISEGNLSVSSNNMIAKSHSSDNVAAAQIEDQFQFSEALVEKGKLSMAEKAFEVCNRLLLDAQSSARCRNGLELDIQLATTKLSGGKYKEAQHDLTNILDHHDGSVLTQKVALQLQCDISTCLLLLGHHGEAKDTLNELLSSKPSDHATDCTTTLIQIRRELAFALACLGYYSEAHCRLEEAWTFLSGGTTSIVDDIDKSAQEVTDMTEDTSSGDSSLGSLCAWGRDGMLDLTSARIESMWGNY
ncbi:hypothetical protein PG984_015473 [Apiospora sp. TS-2023a]